MDTLSYIVKQDNAISSVLISNSPYKLQQLIDMYRTAPDKEEFVSVLCTRLLLESKRPSMPSIRSTESRSPQAKAAS